MFDSLSADDKAKFAAAKRAAGLVQSGMKVGLGTGSTAAWLVKHLGQKISDEGLRIQAVPTSSRTADLAQKVGIEIITLDEAGWLDLTLLQFVLVYLARLDLRLFLLLQLLTMHLAILNQHLPKRESYL